VVFLIPGLIGAAVAFAVSRIKPPVEPWLYRVPIRLGWRIAYLAAAALLVLFVAPSVVTILTDPFSDRSLAVGGMLLFVAGLGFTFWRAARDSAVIVTEQRLFVYPSTIEWRWVEGMERGFGSLRLRTAADGPIRGRTFTIPTALYPLPGDVLALIQRLSGRAA
jgi:hypothetical protein